MCKENSGLFHTTTDATVNPTAYVPSVAAKIFSGGNIDVKLAEENKQMLSHMTAFQYLEVMEKVGNNGAYITESNRTGNNSQIVKMKYPCGFVTQIQVSNKSSHHLCGYVKFSLSDQGKLKVVKGPKENYRPCGETKTTYIFDDDY